ncbi:MAG: glycosyltransferase family 4 protein [Deltaproteobacteria bacterium]|nr:glycosyltransferase family 4 protein [Deltaproteobacteria bacterium]
MRNKILHIITRLDMGGSAQNTLQTCKRLSGKYETILVHGPSHESRMTDLEKRIIEDDVKAVRAQGVKVIALPTMVRSIRPLKDLRALLSLVWLIFKEKPDIVHTHSSKAGILGRLAAKLAGVPHIIHTPHGHVFYGHFGIIASKIFLWVETIFSKFTDRMVALTDGEKNDYIKLSVCPPQKLFKIHSGVDLKQYMHSNGNRVEKKRSLGLDQNSTVIGFVGWLLPIKGPAYLLKAMAHIWPEHPTASLVMVGKGELDVDLRAQALKINANGRIKFLGWREDIHEILPVFDLLVLPSLNEGMGRVLVEAMAAGKPVVASEVGGIPDLVKHGETGYLVRPADERALANGIKKLLNDPESARQMGQRGKEYCRQFSLEAMIQKLDDLYSELI